RPTRRDIRKLISRLFASLSTDPAVGRPRGSPSKEVPMPPVPDWKRALDTGAHFTEVRRSQARKLASELVAQGQLARNQMGAYVDAVVERSRRSSEQLRAIVRTEVERQLGVIGVATKRDLERLEH